MAVIGEEQRVVRAVGDVEVAYRQREPFALALPCPGGVADPGITDLRSAVIELVVADVDDMASGESLWVRGLEAVRSSLYRSRMLKRRM